VAGYDDNVSKLWKNGVAQDIADGIYAAMSVFVVE
jgi:hypothetical protein